MNTTTRCALLCASTLLAGCASVTEPPSASASLMVGSSYVFRGVPQATDGVLQGDLRMAVTDDGATWSVTAWANMNLSAQGDESVFPADKDGKVTEIDLLPEYSRKVDEWTISGGVANYNFPNEVNTSTSELHAAAVYAPDAAAALPRQAPSRGPVTDPAHRATRAACASRGSCSPSGSCCGCCSGSAARTAASAGTSVSRATPRSGRTRPCGSRTARPTPSCCCRGARRACCGSCRRCGTAGPCNGRCGSCSWSPVPRWRRCAGSCCAKRSTARPPCSRPRSAGRRATCC
ncbi:MAG: hypothetical protein FJ265_01215 [Planctomycetes bacterium]|nr:hypothetical protein [Planctomycetota bacterium]